MLKTCANPLTEHALGTNYAGQALMRDTLAGQQTLTSLAVPYAVLKHLHNVKTHFYCPQTFSIFRFPV